MNSNDILEQILVSRGHKTVAEQKTFLKPRYEDLKDPLQLLDMDKAVKRLVEAHAKKQMVGIFGDYDIDGLTATTLLSDAFA